jgi:hypothetical protein
MSGGKGSKKYTIGHKYYASVHMAICHGPIDYLRRIIVGDKAVWNGTVKDGSIGINLPDLFGGEKSEGGIAGSLDVMSGEPTQGQNGHLASLFGWGIPAFRGVCSIILKSFMICSMNPYPKPWRFQAARFPAAVPGANSRINTHWANPAQILAECLTDRTWGLGIDAGQMDMASFAACAQTLQGEGFGLCARWDQTGSAEDFMDEICRIIDGQVQMDPSSGKFGMRLIRPDYDPQALMTLGEDDILQVTDYSRPDPRELINEVVVVFENWDSGVEQSVTEKDTAALALNPAVNSTQFNYQAIPSQALARRVALRELAQASSGLARCTVTATRKAAGLTVGDCFSLSWPPLGIDSMIMRATNMKQGSSTDWRVELECVQDLYGLPQTVFSDIETGWTAPAFDPVAPSSWAIYELPYFLVSQFVAGDSQSAWADLPEGFGFAAVAAAQPAGTTLGINLMRVDPYGVWQADAGISFSDYGDLLEELDDVSTSFAVAPGWIDDLEPNEPILVGQEWMLLLSYDPDTRIASVGRGAMDTVPTAHAAGARVWFLGLSDNSDPNVFVSGQTATLRLQSYAANGELPVASSPQASLVMANRAARPVPPANVRVNGAYRPKVLSSWASSLAWSRRDRQETARIRVQTDGDYLPEAGTEYQIVIREKLFPDSAWESASTTSGLTGVGLSLAGLYTPEAWGLEISLRASLAGLWSLQTNVATLNHSPWEPGVLGMAAMAPPASPATGDAWIVGAGATGAFAGRDLNIAKWKGSWRFRQPSPGDRARDMGDGGKAYEFDGSAWVAAA